MKTKNIDIHVENGSNQRVYAAVVVQARNRGQDRVGEPIVSLLFEIQKRNGKRASLTKFYFRPFTKRSSLIRDLRRIAGDAVVDAAVFDLSVAVNKKCKVKVVPGDTVPAIHVLDPERPE
jgi:hypothetical protein